jgi:hypothetical protein
LEDEFLEITNDGLHLTIPLDPVVSQLAGYVLLVLAYLGAGIVSVGVLRRTAATPAYMWVVNWASWFMYGGQDRIPDPLLRARPGDSPAAHGAAVLVWPLLSVLGLVFGSLYGLGRAALWVSKIGEKK